MNILFTRFPYESAHGGAEVQTISLMKELQKRGHNIAFLGSCPTLTVLCKQYGIPFVELNIGYPPVSKIEIIKFFFRKGSMQKKLEKTLEKFAEHKLDAICMLSLSEKILLTPKALSSEIQVLWIEHDSLGRWLKKNPFLSKLRNLSKHILTICVSEASRRTYIELGWNPSRVVAIPNGIDPSRFKVDKKNLTNSTNENRINIGCVARLHKQKGIDVLLRSIADLPQAYLTIVGIGEEKKSLINIIKELKIMDRVQILDRVGKLGEFYRSLDIFVLPSRTNDPFGMVAAEAMCCGVPTVVTSACGISQDINDGKNGIVVKEDSIDALHVALSFLMTHADRRKAIGNAGKTKALAEFTIKGMVDSYERCLQN